MLRFPRRWFDRIVGAARRLLLRFTAHPPGQWVESSFAEPHHAFFSLTQPKRHYGLYLPGRYAGAKKWPLVVMLHGCKQDALTFASGTRMNLLADREEFVVLYPEQRRLANAYRCWNWFDSSAQRGEGEAALIAGMVRDVTARYALDPARVYIAGMSAGGAMTSIMASCYGNLFAACAVHSGLMYRAAGSASEAMRSMKHGSNASPANAAKQALAREDFAFVPALVIHGREDSTVNPSNADQIVEQFMAMAGSGDAAKPAHSDVAHNQSGEGRYAHEILDYHHGTSLVVRKVMVDGLGHAWSGGDGNYAFNDPQGPDASRMIWAFVSQFERSELSIQAATAVH